jgi:hypothetical protein
MPQRLPPNAFRTRGSIATWRPFLTGVALGLAVLVVVGVAVA